MISRVLRTASCRLGSARRFHQIPFQDDLTEVDDDFFNLEGFKHYKESPDVKAYREKLGFSETEVTHPVSTKHDESQGITNSLPNLSVFTDVCKLEEPVVFISKLSNPYINLAIEDYIYSQMPLPKLGNANRLMFYVNSPCVVIGKNQNPWNEVNLPLLNSLRVPLVRRRSGGGTVVHDTGNVNYSFMTTKDKFDRYTFANLVALAVNKIADPEKHITVTERGDIVTERDNFKVSGSAYKLSKGKSYHHGTMLLNLNLEVLRQLLHRDEAKVGQVQSPAIASVRSPVTNLNIENEAFIESVVDEFKETYGIVSNKQVQEQNEDEFDQTELLGLDGFVQAYSGRNCLVFSIDENTDLPEDIKKVRDELTQWEWKFGSTTKFTHTFTHPHKKFQVTFSIGKKGFLERFELLGADAEVREEFQFLQLVIDRGDQIKYTGSDIAGFITNDAISDWIGESIDGST